MSISLILLLLLFAVATIFVLQCIFQLGMRFDAAYIVGFCLYFDMFGYFYKRVLPGNALFLLVIVPLLPALIAWFDPEKKARDLLQNNGVWLWLLMMLYALVTLAWAPNSSGGLSKMIILMVHAVIPGLYAYVIYKKYGKFSWKVMALLGLAFAAAHLVFGEYSDEYPGRLALPGSNPIFNARMSLITITVCLWGRGIPVWLRIVAIGTAGVSAFATESRGPVAAFIAANLIYALYELYKRYKRGELRNTGTIAVLLFVLLAGGALTASRYTAQLQDWVDGSRFTIFFDRDQLQGDDNFIGRIDLQRKALEKWSEHPFFGGGLGSVTPPIAQDFPHNVVLEIAAELGGLGLSLWLFAYLFTLWSARNQPILVVLLLQTLGTALLSGDFGFNFEYMLIAFVSLALGPPNMEKEVPAGHGQNPVSYYGH